jgi:hypothetical protein
MNMGMEDKRGYLFCVINTQKVRNMNANVKSGLKAEIGVDYTK